MQPKRTSPRTTHMPSVVAGTVFVLIGTLFLAARLLDAVVDGGLVVPVLLIGLGVAGLLRTGVRAVQSPPEPVEEEDPLTRHLREEARRELEDLDGSVRAASLLGDTSPVTRQPPPA